MTSLLPLSSSTAVPTRSVIGENLSTRFNLELMGTRRLISMAGQNDVNTVLVPSLEQGATRAAGLVVPVLKEQHIGAAGIIGIDAMAGQRVALDFDRREVTFQDPRRPVERAAPDEIVVTARRRNGQLVLTGARIGNVEVSAVIDTGAEVTVGNLALLEHLSAHQRIALHDVILTGVTSERRAAQAAEVDELVIVKAELKNFTVMIANLALFDEFGLGNKPALLLGTDVLSTFRRVGLDFNRLRVRFQLRR